MLEVVMPRLESSASCFRAMSAMRFSSVSLNPYLYAIRTGASQNFASLRSRFTWTWTGSPRSLEKKKNRVGTTLQDGRTHSTGSANLFRAMRCGSPSMSGRAFRLDSASPSLLDFVGEGIHRFDAYRSAFTARE